MKERRWQLRKVLPDLLGPSLWINVQRDFVSNIQYRIEGNFGEFKAKLQLAK